MQIAICSSKNHKPCPLFCLLRLTIIITIVIAIIAVIPDADTMTIKTTNAVTTVPP